MRWLLVGALAVGCSSVPTQGNEVRLELVATRPAFDNRTVATVRVVGLMPATDWRDLSRWRLRCADGSMVHADERSVGYAKPLRITRPTERVDLLFAGCSGDGTALVGGGQ